MPSLYIDSVNPGSPLTMIPELYEVPLRQTYQDIHQALSPAQPAFQGLSGRLKYFPI